MNEYLEWCKKNPYKVPLTIKLLIKRHKEDLLKTDSPYYFDQEEPERVITFIQRLKHVKGKWRGQFLILEPVQKFIIYLIFGWKYKKSGLRRFRKVYFQIARKNAKTTLAVGILLYLFYKAVKNTGEGEFYSIATKRDQAKISFKIARAMVEAEKSLTAITKTNKNVIEKGECSFVAMSSEDKKSDGFNPYVVLVDEYHAHKTDEQLQVYQDGMGSREEPLILITTTSGYNKSSPCFEEYERSKKILTGIYEDDSFLPIIYELDEEDKKDNWKNTDFWIKANPNLNISVSLEYLKTQLNEALQKTSKKVSFLTKNLNMWVDSKSAWIMSDSWLKNIDKSFDEDDLIGCSCCGAIDLSSVNDLTGYTLSFLLPDGRIYQKHRCYIPEESIAKKEKHEHVQFRKWIEKGYVTATPYDFVDHQYLVDDLISDSELYNIQEIAFDKAYSGSVVSQLINEGFDMVEFAQGILNFSNPTKEWETDLLKGNLVDNNPVMAWCVSNAVIKPDTNNNYKPLKEAQHKKIDLVITSIMSHNRLKNNSAGPRLSVLDFEGDGEEKTESENDTISTNEDKKIISIMDLI